jgi:transposase-like protein
LDNLNISGSYAMMKTEDLLGVVGRSAAWQLLRHLYHPAGPVCPGCGSAIEGSRAVAAWSELRRVYCAGCGHKFQPTVGTPIHETSWQPEEFVQLLLLADAGRRPAQIAAVLGKSVPCVRDMLDRVKLIGVATSLALPTTA